MTSAGTRPHKCACGRETWRPEIVRGKLLCSTCAFEAEYGAHVPANGRGDISDYFRPRFSIKRVS